MIQIRFSLFFGLFLLPFHSSAVVDGGEMSFSISNDY